MRNVEAVRESLVNQGARVLWAKPHGVCFTTTVTPARFMLGGPALTVIVAEPLDSSELREDIDRATDLALCALADAAKAGPVPDLETSAHGARVVRGVVVGGVAGDGVSHGSGCECPDCDELRDPFAGVHD